MPRQGNAYVGGVVVVVVVVVVGTIKLRMS